MSNKKAVVIERLWWLRGCGDRDSSSDFLVMCCLSCMKEITWKGMICTSLYISNSSFSVILTWGLLLSEQVSCYFEIQILQFYPDFEIKNILLISRNAMVLFWWLLVMFNVRKCIKSHDLWFLVYFEFVLFCYSKLRFNKDRSDELLLLNPDP